MAAICSAVGPDGRSRRAVAAAVLVVTVAALCRVVRTRVGARRALAVAALLVTSVTVVQVVRPRSGATIGPVIAVTPDQVVPDGFVGYVFHPTISGRGEAVAVHDAEVRENGFVLLDTAGADAMVRGDSIAVSGDGCTAFWARPSGSPNAFDATLIGVTDRCAGSERGLITTSTWYDDAHQVAVSHDGRFGVVLLQDLPPGTEFPSPRLVRVDTRTGDVRNMPLPAGYFGWDATNGVDISDDGNLVVVPVVGVPPGSVQTAALQDVALWDVGAGSSVAISVAGALQPGSASFPGISGNGRFVSWAASKPYAGTESGTGPWVYVRDRVTGATRLVSAANGTAYDSSLSRDGSQVAYTVAPGPCQYETRQFDDLEFDCPGLRIDVAYSATPGLGSGVAVETVSLDAGGSAVGEHVEPDLSANGRWVTWVSDAYGPLLGVTSDETGLRHAFVRRRDPALVVDPLDVGTIPAGSSVVRTTTVRNTGRTSVYVERIDPAPGEFTAVGGSCAIGAIMPPGSTCTVDVRFAAPAATTTVDGSMIVGEVGFDPVTANGMLRGASQTAATTTAPPATVTTTLPAITTTSVAGQASTTTTAPGTMSLTATPNPVDFGGVAAGIGSPVETVTVRNTGTAGGVLLTTLTGPHPDDFFVSRNGCNAVDLGPGATCTVDIILIARDAGPRSAVLSVTSGDAAVDVPLRGVGTFEPRLVVTPAAVTQRGFTTVIGQGFPPGDVVVVEIGDGLERPVTPDEIGEFRIPIAPAGILGLGNHPVQVDGREDVYDDVRSQLVVVLPTFEPQGPGGPAFGSSIIVTRGA